MVSDLALHCHGSVHSGMHAEDGGLGRVDNRCPEHGAKHSSIGDGECSSIHLLYSQRAIPSLGKRGDVQQCSATYK